MSTRRRDIAISPCVDFSSGEFGKYFALIQEEMKQYCENHNCYIRSVAIAWTRGNVKIEYDFEPKQDPKVENGIFA